MGNRLTDTVPQTLTEAIKLFADPDVCLAFAVSVVWPDGKPTCPDKDCQSKDAHFIATRRIWRCRSCKRQYSVKVGTIFEDSPLPLEKWFTAIWLVANCKNGISSYEMSRHLGVMQRTAWFMDHRIRLAMKTGTFRKMEGTVEADETFVGGLEKNKHANKKLRQGRGTVGKAIVQGVIERGQPGRKSRVVAKVVKNTDAKTLQGNLAEYVVTGTYVYTDAHRGYSGLSDAFVHDFIDHAVIYARGTVHTNGIECFWNLLKRGLKGTYVAVMPFHLDRYVDEQAFRFNEREGNDADRFVKVLSQVAGRRLTWDELTASDDEFYALAYAPA